MSLSFGRTSIGADPHRRPEDRNRTQLYEIAKELNIPGRSRISTWGLIDAIRRSR
ncbi:MAG: hypothetical protein ACXWYN_10485 [Actinomycetota bacterium]